MSFLRDLPPGRWLRRLRDILRRWGDMYRPIPNVSFDAERVRIAETSGEDAGFPWEAVRRIGYRTVEAWGEDYYLEFQLADGRDVWIGMTWPGAMALSDHVDQLPDTRIDPKRGVLANVTRNDSIIIWPSSEAGGSMDDQSGAQRAEGA